MAAAAAGSLAGQRVAIFGGSSGMGRGAAAAVLRSGASVVLIGRDEAKLAATKVWLGGDSRVSTLVADANDEAAVKAAFSTLFPPEQPRLNHVLCTVGPSVGGGLVESLDVSKALEQMRVKFIVGLTVAKHAIPFLADSGSLTYVTGSLNRRPSPGSAALAAANAALDSLAKSLAVELAPRLRANAVSPGLCDTEIWDGMPAEQRAAMYAGYAKGNLMGRMGTVQDVGEAAAFLMSATWVTGTVLEVDGGTTVKP